MNFNFVRRDPVGFAYLVHASLVLLMAFGLNLSNLQLAAINMEVAAILTLVVKQHVTPIAPGGSQ